jgi:hypothetical protein
MSSLTLYREMVPGHALVQDEIVDLWLSLAAQRHTTSTWGAVYAAAMVSWAAAHIEPLRATGAVGLTGAGCAPTPANTTPAPSVSETPYWHWYLGYRESRAAGAPRRVAP